MSTSELVARTVIYLAVVAAIVGLAWTGHLDTTAINMLVSALVGWLSRAGVDRVVARRNGSNNHRPGS